MGIRFMLLYENNSAPLRRFCISQRAHSHTGGPKFARPCVRVNQRGVRGRPTLEISNPLGASNITSEKWDIALHIVLVSNAITMHHCLNKRININVINSKGLLNGKMYCIVRKKYIKIWYIIFVSSFSTVNILLTKPWLLKVFPPHIWLSSWLLSAVPFLLNQINMGADGNNKSSNLFYNNYHCCRKIRELYFIKKCPALQFSF